MKTYLDSTIKHVASLALMMVMVLLSGCGRDTTSQLNITGASTVYPIIEMAKEGFTKQHDIRLNVQAGGSTRGFEDTLAGRNDFGAMARDLTAEEAAQVEIVPIAYDGIGIVVHASNPLESITTETLQRIYRKEITNWSQLGGPNEPIVAVNKADGHATLKVFMKHAGLTRDEIKADVVAGDNAQVIRVAANTKGAVAYVSMGEVIEAAAIGMELKLVKLDGIEPTIEQVASETYPLRRTLYLVSKAPPAGNASLLLQFLGSEEGKQIIKRGNYVPLP
ncbi:phosphate ABC transporter substrate-binding protein [Endozoicomonadaceae bacterium StTr2]